MDCTPGRDDPVQPLVAIAVTKRLIPNSFYSFLCADIRLKSGAYFGSESLASIEGECLAGSASL